MKKTSSSPAVSKTAFIRGLPLDLPVEDVLQKGKDAGYDSISTGTINSTRTLMRKEQGYAAKSGPRKVNGASSGKIPEISATANDALSSNHRAALIAAVFELGFQGVLRELETIRKQFQKSIMGGG